MIASPTPTHRIAFGNFFNFWPSIQMNKNQIAETFSKRLAEQARQSPADAVKNPLILEVRKFLKKMPKEDPRFENCRRELLAAKLGITTEILKANPSFEKFANETKLDRYLLEYNHTLKVDELSKQLFILKDGAYIAWDEANKIIESYPKRNIKPALKWIYGMQGIQNEDMYDWTELTPFKEEDPHNWGYRYIFEFCVCCKKSPQKTEDHSWLRLRKSTGEVYSVGLYRPGKSGKIDNLNSPMALKPGYLQKPDVSEFWPDIDVRVIQVAITKEDFENIKETIEGIKKNQDNIVFQPFAANCTLFIKAMAEIAGFDVPTSKSVLLLLTPRIIEKCLNKIHSWLPPSVAKICKFVLVYFIFYIPIFLLNLVQLALGAARSKVKNRAAKPYFGSILDIFKPSKLIINHPHTLGTHTYKWVNEWREKEKIKKMQEVTDPKLLELELDNIKYALPPECYIKKTLSPFK